MSCSLPLAPSEVSIKYPAGFPLYQTPNCQGPCHPSVTSRVMGDPIEGDRPEKVTRESKRIDERQGEGSQLAAHRQQLLTNVLRGRGTEKSATKYRRRIGIDQVQSVHRAQHPKDLDDFLDVAIVFVVNIVVVVVDGLVVDFTTFERSDLAEEALVDA